MTDEPTSNRCTTCQIAWPYYDDEGNPTDEFDVCPKCGRSTGPSRWQPTYASYDEAIRAKKEFLFDAYVETRDAADRKLLERVEPFAFAQYLMDAADEQRERDGRVLE